MGYQELYYASIDNTRTLRIYCLESKSKIFSRSIETDSIICKIASWGNVLLFADISGLVTVAHFDFEVRLADEGFPSPALLQI